MAATILLALVSSLLLISPTLSSTTNILSSTTNVLYSDLSIPDGRLVYGDYSFGLNRCKLVLYANDTVAWEAGRFIHPLMRCNLTLESDGELIVRGTILGQTFITWRSGVRSTVGRYALVLKYDGTVHVYGPAIWSKPGSLTKSGTDRSDRLPSTTASSSAAVDSTFWTDDIAPIGTTIANGHYELELHGSCNLTLSNGQTNKTLWYTDTHDKYRLYDCFVTLAGDGNIVIKYVGGAPLWTSGATGPSGSDYVLALRPDGNAAVYGPSIWFAGAVNKTAGGEAVAAGAMPRKSIAMVTELP